MISSSSRIHYAWVVLVIGTLVVFGALGLARFGYTVVLPTMQEDLGLSNTQTGMLATANMLGYLALSAIGGALASHYGPRAIISIGLLLSGLSMLFTGLAHGFLGAAFWRAFAGSGSGLSNVAVMGLISAWFATQKRGLASGIVVSGSSFALIFSGPFVSHLIASYGNNGWRICWIVFGCITLFLAVIGFIFLRNQPSEINITPFGAHPDELPKKSKASAIQWARVYRSVPVWHLGIVYIAFGFSYVIYITFFFKRLIAEGGYTQAAAGNLFMIIGWCSLFCGVLWGTASDLIGRKRALIIVYLIHAIAFSLFALWPSPPGFTISAVLYGLTAWSIPAIMGATCGDVLGPQLAPAAFGFITIFLGIGQVAGPAIAGRIADTTGSFSPAYLLAAGVALLGSIGASFLRPASTIATTSSK